MRTAKTGTVLAYYPPNTYGYELTRLAVRLGLHSSTADGPALPEGSTLEQLQEGYTEAAERFWRHRAWSWACPTISVSLSSSTTSLSVNGQTTAYVLPFQVTGQPMCARVNDVWDVESADPATIRRENALYTEHTGAPQAIGIEDRALTKESQTRQSVLYVYPRPNQDYTLEFRAKRAMMLPRDLTDELPWGEDHNQTVSYIAESCISRDDANAKSLANAALEKSVELDAKAWGSGVVMSSPVVGIGTRRKRVIQQWAT